MKEQTISEKKILIAGASGMIGSLILKNALKSDDVTSVICLVRHSLSISDPKLTEIKITDFKNYSSCSEAFGNIDAAYFCIGVYSGNVSNKVLKEVTFDYAVNFAQMLKEKSPDATLCLLSGAGADQTGRSKIAFARYKGLAEAEISKLKTHFYTFRPGYIYPVTPRKEPNRGYKILRLMYPLIKLLGKKYSIRSTELADVMFKVGLNGFSKNILENLDMVELCQQNLPDNKN